MLKEEDRAYFVAIFKLTIISASVLHSVIRQMNQPVLYILEVVLATTSPQVALLIEVALKIAVHCSGQCVATNIKFALLIQQWSLTVLLDDVGAFLAIYMRVADDLPDLTQFSAHSNTTASVCVLAWFYDPELFAHRWVLRQVDVIVGPVVCLLELCEG